MLTVAYSSSSKKTVGDEIEYRWTYGKLLCLFNHSLRIVTSNSIKAL
jgi:hypothetical protein